MNAIMTADVFQKPRDGKGSVSVDRRIRCGFSTEHGAEEVRGSEATAQGE